MPSSASSVMRWKLPADFDIFRPLMSRCAPCTQTRAGGPPTIGADWAISSSWWGKTLSSPPVWMSNVGPRWRRAIAEHSRCQPGKPSPQRLGQRMLATGSGPGRLPEREVGGIALVRLDVAPVAGPQVVERVARQRAVARERRDLVVQVAGRREVGVPEVLEPLGEVEHLGDVLGGARDTRVPGAG